MSNNKLLLLFTNHRVAEKLWALIPKLSKEYKLDLFLVGLMSNETPWVGDIDERNIIISKYKPYINTVINGPGIKYHGDNISVSLDSYINIKEYTAVIFDDNRKMSEFNIPNFYNICKQNKVIVIGNSHGNEDVPHDATNISYDYKMDFQSGGIPANDTLKNIKQNNKHILVICNFLGNRFSPFNVNFDKDFVNTSGLIEMSNHYNLPIFVKIKTRLDNPNYTDSVEFVKSLLDCTVVVNTDNTNQLIADSAFVISAPSTLALKPIQLGIPTILIKGSGAIGCYKDYPGLVDLNKQQIFDNLSKQINHGKYCNFLDTSVAGGKDFTSTKVYIKKIKQLIYEHNL
jgi:hypothetical protein